MAGHPGSTKDQPLLRAGLRPFAVEESALRAAVSQRLGEVRFGRWFGDGVRLALSGEGDALEVRVPDSFFREWIQRHYSASLLEAAEAVVGRPVRLSIQVHGGAQTSPDNVVETRPRQGEPDSQTAESRIPRWMIPRDAFSLLMKTASSLELCLLRLSCSLRRPDIRQQIGDCRFRVRMDLPMQDRQGVRRNGSTTS